MAVAEVSATGSGGGGPDGGDDDGKAGDSIHEQAPG